MKVYFRRHAKTQPANFTGNSQSKGSDSLRADRFKLQIMPVKT